MGGPRTTAVVDLTGFLTQPMATAQSGLLAACAALVVVSCGGGSGSKSSDPSSPITPTVTLNANPGSVASGGVSTLSWNSTGANECTASGAWSGSKATSGSQSTGTLTTTSTYSLSCSGAAGNASASATVTVGSASSPPTVSLSASPTKVASGAAASLSWSSTEATSCTATGAWSGTRATSGSASTAPLTNSSNIFTLTCTGAGGSGSASVIVTVDGAAQLGLDFQGSAATAGTVRFRFTNPLAIYPATYIWRLNPRSQPEYYTTFFWGNDGEFFWDNGFANTTYGAHPYPNPSPNNVSRPEDVGPRFWEIAVAGKDVLSPTEVEYNRWHTQALRVWSDSSGKHHEFYWDLPDTSRVIRDDEPDSYGNKSPPSPALTWGDAPWNPSKEIMLGVIRGIQIYSAQMSLADVLAESTMPLSTSAGIANVWYLNMNPTPTDISDKSGAGHDPQWVGPERPLLWTGP
jgi:hypothetical protein